MKDTPAYFVTGADRPGRWIITCDHARNRVPDWVNGGDLGIAASDMQRHIALDPGAEAVSLHLGAILDCPVICSNFSRLVIDPNRGADDPTLITQLYDGTLISGNRGLSEADRQKRVDNLYQPYHDATAALFDARVDPVMVSMHSFTPRLAGKPPRPWQVGILFADDQRLSAPLITELAKDTSLTVGVNEPYIGYLPGDSVSQHALRQGRFNALIELRNDLIANDADQQAWAQRLAPALINALKTAEESH